MNLQNIHPVRAALALSAWGIILYLSVVGQPISDGLWVIATAITGVYLATAKD